MSSWHNARWAIIRCKIIQQPDGRNDAKRLSASSGHPVCVQSLLTITRKRIATAKLAQSKWASEHVINGGKNSRMCEDNIEGSGFVDGIVDVPGTTLRSVC